MRRSDLLNRKIDMERLQRMAKGADSDAIPAAKRGKTVVPVGKVIILLVVYILCAWMLMVRV